MSCVILVPLCCLVYSLFALVLFRDCESYFGVESLEPITEDDDVTCVTQFSKVVPLEGGEVSVNCRKLDTLVASRLRFQCFHIENFVSRYNSCILTF